MDEPRVRRRRRRRRSRAKREIVAWLTFLGVGVKKIFQWAGLVLIVLAILTIGFIYPIFA